MNELAVRTLVGMLLVAVALAAAALGGYVFASLCAAAACVMFYEWQRLVRGWGTAWWLAGFAYALIPALSLLWIRERPEIGLLLLLWVFIVTWSTDIGAYFAGRTFGGPKLAPAISPNKTISGLVGGMTAAELLGSLWAWQFGLPTALFFLAAPFAFAAQMGDLFESHLKRKAQVKDSGTIFPGHGGMLDRLDGLVMVASLTAFASLAGLL